MRPFHFSISLKLFVLILPLVCLPIILVGYWSYHNSVQSVSRLARDEQLLQAKVAAAQINAIFESCLADLESISRIVSDHYRVDLRDAGIRPEQSLKITGLFNDFIVRSPYYLRIRLADLDNRMLLRVAAEGVLDSLMVPSAEILPAWDTSGRNDRRFFISKVTPTSKVHSYYMFLAKPILRYDNTPVGSVIIDLNFDKVIELVSTLRIGKRGYAFLVDQLGHTIAHPDYAPYQYDFTKYDDARHREFVINMITGESGWMTFNLEGEKAAAYAPVDATRWSLAVSTPLAEFVSEAEDLRQGVIQVVVAAIFLTGCAVAFISYKLLRPIKTLAAATEHIAAGDLSQELPVHSGDEMGMLTRSFNHMVRSLREIQKELVASEKLISLGRLSAGVAHEIRNPLNAMKGAISYLQRRRADDSLSMEYTGLILEEIDRLGEFVNEFLYFARQSRPRKAFTDLNGLIQGTLSLFEEELRNKQIVLKINLDPALPQADVDPRQIEQVLMNLIVNAIHAMPEGGVLILTSRPESRVPGDTSGTVLITIEDDGCGIDATVLKNIFDPFFSTKESGTGLGLPISLGIVEGHGGSLKVTSQPRQGTVVTIVLPVHGPNGLKEKPVE